MKNKFIFITIIFLCLILNLQVDAQKVKHKFELGDSTFLLNGKPFQIISGGMHYPLFLGNVGIKG